MTGPWPSGSQVMSRSSVRERSFYAQDPFGNKICFVDQSTLFTGG